MGTFLMNSEIWILKDPHHTSATRLKDALWMLYEVMEIISPGCVQELLGDEEIVIGWWFDMTNPHVCAALAHVRMHNGMRYLVSISQVTRK
jgi:hypothetical protein